MNFAPTLNLTPYCDRSSVHSCSRYQPYPYTSLSEPESESYYPGYSSYIPHSRVNAVSRLKDERLKCERCLGWNIDWAVAFVINHLNPANSPDAADALRRIRIFAENLATENRSLDIAYRIFNKLDQVLFAGHLKNAVFLDFKNLGTNVSGATFTHGHGPNPRVRRISIVLNSSLHQHARARDIIASLVHQMIHAFFLVACGPQDEKEEGYGRLAHGVHFGKVMETIKNLSATNCKPLALNYGHNLRPHSYYDDYYPLLRPRRLRNGKWYSSHCHALVDAIPEKDVAEWYSGVCHPLLDLPESVRKATILVYNERHHELEEVPRSAPTTPPSIDSVEFLFQEKAILVPGAKIDNFLSIRRAFDKTKSRYLTIHEDFDKDKDTFMRLLELLHLGRYAPDISPVCAPGRKGPPVIKPLHHESAPYLLTDVRLFKLGAAMGFDEVKGVALERLNTQYVTREDPVAVLLEIYDGSDPDPDLRSWAQGFLTKGPEKDWLDPGLGISMGISSAGAGRDGRGSEPPNLVKLDQDMGFKMRFRDLVGSSSALHIDVLKAKAYVCASMGPRGMGVSVFRQPSPPFGMGRQASPPLGVGIDLPPRAGGLKWAEDEYERYERYGPGYGYEAESCYDGWEDMYRGWSYG